MPKRVSRENIGRRIYKARGCEDCADGYKGRTAIMELLEIGDDIDSLIKSGATEKGIRDVAEKKQGMVFMQEDGILKTLQGITSTEEVEKETGSIVW